MSFRSLLYSCAGAAVMSLALSPPSSAETLLSPTQMDGVTAGTAGNEAVVHRIIVGDLDLSTNEILSHVTPVGRIHLDSDGGKLMLLLSVDDTAISIRDVLDGTFARTLSRVQADDRLSVAFAEARAVSTLPNDAIVTTRELRTTSGSEHTVVIRSHIESQGRAAVQSISQSIQQAIQQ